ncbi:unnamed protein product [Meganyctiphanes norvegica]|uniref:Metalloendopeptidase n=1 Tax=Meganyctiphanes norvegica TaxID=48144 RepID=A0AAV2QU23_MEGNR
MFVRNVVLIILATLLSVAKTNEELPNVIIGDPNNASSDVIGPAISEAEFEAALANENLVTYQPEDNSALTSQDTFFQGDIQIKSKDQLIEILQNKEGYGQSSAISNPSLKWPNAQIPYFISSSFSTAERAVIARAMAEYHQQTCITFIPRTTHTNYIHILKGRGCSSMIGRVGGAQTVSLGSGCVNYGTVLHELMHATGFWHEQSRFDRDNYVTINWSNVIKGMAYNFNKKTHSVTQDLGLPYDYSSVMHYAQYAFARDRAVPTIYPKQHGAQIYGSKKGFSMLDKKGLNLLYQCSGTTKPKPSSCEDTNNFCSDWASKGQCQSNPAYMHVHCKKSCNKCGTTVYPKPVNPKPTACVDKNQYCADWAKKGYCISNAAYMKPSCPKSCKACDNTVVSTNCVDTNAFCPDWATKGQCNSNPAYMHKSCKKSCSKC